MFWCTVQKIVEESKQNKLHFYRKLVLNAAREKNPEQNAWREYFKFALRAYVGSLKCTASKLWCA